MRIRWQLSILFGILFIPLAGFVFYFFKDNAVHLYVAEAGLLLLLILFVGILGRITRPLDQISTGVDALKDQDFSGLMRSSGSREIDRLVDVYNQMLENIKKERMFQQEQHFFLQNLIESLPVGLVILDFDNKLREYNPVARDILGIQESDKGKELAQSGLLLREEILSQEIRYPKTYKIDGTRYLRLFVDHFKHRGFYQKFVILEEAGDEILKVEKESYGKVIRMMAHEVKNSVGAVNSILETLETVSGFSQEEISEYLRIVIDRNTRLNVFMENFARVVRLQVPEKTLFNLSEVVSSVYHLMKLRFQDKPVTFLLHTTEEPVMLRGSQEQMEQVLINLVLNAFEAIPFEGKIDLNLSHQELHVTDNGSGISEETQGKLFTPFFSTKPTGQGVGLTMVREILHQHGFSFKLSSGEGSTVFKIIFKPSQVN